ncbi:MAG: plasminogen-binding N-terminal domain-containing protein [Nautiliaceae bacterium]
MRVVFLLILGLFLSAYEEVSILNVNANKVVLSKSVQKGVSGYVICKDNNLSIICARAVGDLKKATLYPYEDLKNSAFALPVVLPKKHDKIIFKKDYERVLIIAPNQDEYLKVKSFYKNATFISPDIFAAYIDDIPTKEDFINFAKIFNIGRMVFVLDRVYEVDSFSFYAVKVYGKFKAAYKKAFFTTYPKFDIKGKNFINYYKNLIKGAK